MHPNPYILYSSYSLPFLMVNIQSWSFKMQQKITVTKYRYMTDHIVKTNWPALKDNLTRETTQHSKPKLPMTAYNTCNILAMLFAGTLVFISKNIRNQLI